MLSINPWTGEANAAVLYWASGFVVLSSGMLVILISFLGLYRLLPCPSFTCVFANPSQDSDQLTQFGLLAFQHIGVPAVFNVPAN